MAMVGCERIVALIDMDCFYVQVEQRRNPSIRGKPCAVVQYNQWKGGGIIAVSYEARAKGVSRNMRGDDAKKHCPDIILCMVPTANGKADLTRYRDAGAEVIQVLLQFGGRVERASIDEAYIDVTDLIDEKLKSQTRSSEFLQSLSSQENTFVVGHPKDTQEFNLKPDENSDRRLTGLTEYMGKTKEHDHTLGLLMAAQLVNEMRCAIFQQTSFRCSAGISHNKVLSKLACGLHKPNKQTILPMEEVPMLFNQVKIGKIRNLGGKLGQQLSQNFGVEYIGQLASIEKMQLIQAHGRKTGEWLYEICRGVDHEPVKERHVAQSVGCSKQFNGVEALNTKAKVKHWVDCLVTELVERLIRDKEINNRTAKGLTAYVGLQGRKSVSRSCYLDKYDVSEVSRSVFTTLEQLNESNDRNADLWHPAITMVGISAGKFQDRSGKPPNSSSSKCPPVNKKHSVKSFLTSPVKQPIREQPEAHVTISSHYFEKQQNSDDSSTSSDKRFAHPKTKAGDKDSSKTKKNTSLLDKKNSFFAKMLEANSTKSPTCKIESAFCEHDRDQETFEELCVDQEQENNVTISRDCNYGGTSTTTNKQPLPNDASEKSSCDSWLDTNGIDENVFRSLPLYLQQEIRLSYRNVDGISQVTKRRKMAPSSGQSSIAEFFTCGQSEKQSTVKKSPSKKVAQKRKDRKSKPGKDSVQFNSLEQTCSVPFGFFRARTQASMAIRSAVERHALTSSQRKRPENNNFPMSGRVSNGISLDQPRDLHEIDESKNSDDLHSIWSSIHCGQSSD